MRQTVRAFIKEEQNFPLSLTYITIPKFRLHEVSEIMWNNSNILRCCFQTALRSNLNITMEIIIHPVTLF